LPQLEIVDLKANYGSHTVLERINLSVDKGEIVSLIGPSGSGKSTLLRVLMGLLPPIEGQVRIDGQALDYNDREQLRRLRSQMAIVFQQYNLFQNMSVLGNVTIAPVKINKRPRAEVEAEARRLLESVGLGDKLEAYPDQLSGGQQQRVAIARALVHDPPLVIADEPTAHLDYVQVESTLRLGQVNACKCRFGPGEDPQHEQVSAGEVLRHYPGDVFVGDEGAVDHRVV